MHNYFFHVRIMGFMVVPATGDLPIVVVLFRILSYGDRGGTVLAEIKTSK